MKEVIAGVLTVLVILIIIFVPHWIGSRINGGTWFTIWVHGVVEIVIYIFKVGSALGIGLVVLLITTAIYETILALLKGEL